MRNVQLVAWYLVALALALACAARAASPPLTFGVEQELRNPVQWLAPTPFVLPGLRLLRVPMSVAKQSDLITTAIMRQLLSEYKREERRNPGMIRVEGEHIILPQVNFGFKVTADFTVIEMPTDPYTLEQLKAARDQIKYFMFQVPLRIGLQPDTFFRAGHVHIGLTAFEGDPLKYLNFIIDFVNHSELGSGVLLYDPVNAAPPLQTRVDREAFKAVLADFDAGKLRTIEEIRDRLLPIGFAKEAGAVQSGLNLKPKAPTVEVRSNASFDTVDQMIDITELFQNRVLYLNQKTERLTYFDTGPIMNQQQLLDQFYLYVTEAGGDWNRFRNLLPRKLKRPSFVPHPENAFPYNPHDAGFFYKCRWLFSRIRSLY